MTTYFVVSRTDNKTFPVRNKGVRHEALLFHFRRGDEILSDEEGELLADYSAACRQAERSVRELLASAIKFRKGRIPDSLVIADEQGLELGTVWFEAVLLTATRK